MTRKKPNAGRRRKRLLAKAAVAAAAAANSAIATLVRASNDPVPDDQIMDDDDAALSSHGRSRSRAQSQSQKMIHIDGNSNGYDSARKYHHRKQGESRHFPKSKLQELRQLSSALRKVHENRAWTGNSLDILRSLDESHADYYDDDGNNSGNDDDDDVDEGNHGSEMPAWVWEREGAARRMTREGSRHHARNMRLTEADGLAPLPRRRQPVSDHNDVATEEERRPNLRGRGLALKKHDEKESTEGEGTRRKLGRGVGVRRPDAAARHHGGWVEEVHEEDCIDLTDLDQVMWGSPGGREGDRDVWGSPGGHDDDYVDDDDYAAGGDDNYARARGSVRWPGSYHRGPYDRNLAHHYYFAPSGNAYSDWGAKGGKQSKTGHDAWNDGHAGYGSWNDGHSSSWNYPSWNYDAKSGKADGKGGKGEYSHWNSPSRRSPVVWWSSPQSPRSPDWWSPAQSQDRWSPAVSVNHPSRDSHDGPGHHSAPRGNDNIIVVVTAWEGGGGGWGGGGRSGKADKGGKDGKQAKSHGGGGKGGKDQRPQCFIIKDPAPPGQGYCGADAANAESQCRDKCDDDGDCPGGQGCFDVGTACQVNYCGTSFDDASERCAIKCEDDGDCPGGQGCFDGIFEEDCPDDGDSYCGADFDDAGTNCDDGETCDGGDCGPGQYCFAGVTTCPASNSWCGTSLPDAEGKCEVKCSSSEDCPNGESCYDGVIPCGVYPDSYCGVTFDDASAQCRIKCDPNDNGGRAFLECPSGESCYGGVTGCPDDGNGFCGADYEDAASQCLRGCVFSEDCPRGEFCFDGVTCAGPDPTPGPTPNRRTKRPTPGPPGPTPTTPAPNPPPGPGTDPREGCIDPNLNSPLPCPPEDMKKVCDKHNDELYPPGSDRAGELVSNFEDCYDMCKPSFCCIHDSLSKEYSPSCANDGNGNVAGRVFFENCPLYYPCYIIWWKLHDTIGPATYLRLEQDEPFYENLNFEYLRQDWLGDKDFFQQLLGHHFDTDDPVTQETFETISNW